MKCMYNGTATIYSDVITLSFLVVYILHVTAGSFRASLFRD